MFDPNIQKYKTTTMQRLQDFVRTGYYHHVSGKVSAERAQLLANKFAEQYQVDVSKFVRSRRKAKGWGNAVLILYPIVDSTDFWWWLLVTEGEHSAHQKEQLCDARNKHQRVCWADEYELVRMTKKEQSKPSWTWRMTAPLETYWEQRIRKAISSYDDSLIKQAIWSLYRTPGFSGIRNNVGQLVKHLRGDWQRIKRGSIPLPHIPQKLNYLARLPDETYPLSTLVQRQKRGAVSWFPRKKKNS